MLASACSGVSAPLRAARYNSLSLLVFLEQVFLGAAALLSNGTAVSRVGTATVAMVAAAYNKPVLLCCETIKFSEKVLLDSICSNELGDPDELVAVEEGRVAALPADTHAHAASLKLLNLMYDLTPAHYIAMVITEVGLIPPTSVPVVVREYRREFKE